jgi:hypothetical protein
MSKDHVPLLKYASMAKLDRERKIFCTISPVMNGDRWWHRGITSIHLLPDPTSDVRPSWEGVMTFPDQAKYPVMMVNGDFDGVQRLFVLCYDSNGKVALAEITEKPGDDMVGCEPVRVPCSVITGKFIASTPLTNKSFNSITPIFSGIRGRVDWRVSIRTDRHQDWLDITSNGSLCSTSSQKSNPLASWHPASAVDTYGIPDQYRNAKWIQVRVTWLGIASLDGVRVDFDTFDQSLDQSSLQPQCYSEMVESCDGDFDYPTTLASASVSV